MRLHEVLKKLIAFESVTPMDLGCQEYMMQLLTELGFRCETFNKSSVSNFYAEFGSDAGPLLLLAGHTDVVPVGDESQWRSSPFCLTEQGGMYYGRGVADMKGSLACMLLACQRFVEKHPKPLGRLGLLITSGEEGDDYMHGTPHVMQALHKRGITPDYCIVGEPSSTSKVGDVVKIGRRGSLSARAKVFGIQGHVAYPHLAKNPIHMLAPVIADLSSKVWDNGSEFFPATTMQITRIHADGGAGNVIPSQIELDFNFRYSVLQTAEKLQEAVANCFKSHAVEVTINWIKSGEPFLTATGKLVDVCRAVIQECTGQDPELSTSGGTSDGRFIAPYGVELIELGPVNATIHQVNECVAIKDLEILTDLYYQSCVRLLS